MNRAGQLTNGQIAQAHITLIPYLLLAIITLTLLLFVLFSYPWSRSATYQQIVLIFITGLLGVACLFGVFKMIGVLRDLSSHKADFVDGEIKVRSYQLRGSAMGAYYSRTNYFYRIGRKEFFCIPHGAHRALVANVQYRVYYAASSKMFLSLEPLSFSA